MIVARRNRALGILDLAGGDCRRLEADERPEREWRGGRDRAPGSLGGERRQVVAVDEEEPDHADDREGHELEDRGDDLNRAGLACARDVDQCQQPDHRDAHECREQIVGSQVTPEDGEVTDERHGDCGVPRPGGNPVAPGGLEPDEVAEGTTRVRVRASGSREGAPETREDEGQQHGSHAGEDPADDR